MDANTRRRLEIEGYRELGMWGEAQELLETWSDEIPDRPETIAFLVMLGVSVEFGGPARIPARSAPVRAVRAKAELAAF
jgi:hypothetical protein